MENYKTRGIVLHSVRYGDTGHIVYMYTERFARQAFYVTGNRGGRPVIGKSRILLEPLTVIDFVGYKSLKGEMHRIREATNSFLFSGIVFDIRKSSIALFMAEVIYRIVREDAPNPLFFDFLLQCVKTLNAIEEGTANFHIYFLVQLTRFLGFYPANNYMEYSFFDIRRGEFVMLKPQHSFFIPQEESRLLGLFLNSNVDTLGAIRISRALRVSLLNSLIAFIGYHHDAAYRIGSIKILGELF